MILQNPITSDAINQSRFVIKNVEHAALSEQLLRHIGNDEFMKPEPLDDMVFLAAHHDHGWLELDEMPPVNDEDGLPYNLVKTPMDYILKTSKASPDYNEAHSVFCGLLSSMHTYGLYNGRYGLSDAINLSWIPEDKKPAVDVMLQFELARQERLKSKLADTPLADEELILTAYKYLQFIDGLALYFNMNPEGQRGTGEYRHVPQQSGVDVDIKVSETEANTYRFSPYPFDEDELELYFEGRYLQTGALSADQTAMQTTKIERQHLKIVRN